MAIDFTSATGHLFNRLGAVIKTMELVQTYQGTTIPTATADVNAQYAADVNDVPTLSASNINAQNNAQQFLSDMVTIATNTLVDMIQADTPQPQATIQYAMPELITQMNAASATVKACTVGSSVAAGGSNVGNGTILVSLVNGAGITLETVTPDILNCICTQDAQSGQGATAGQEQFTCQGALPIDKLNWAWPGGEGGNVQLTATSAAISGSTQNALTNSNFEAFTVANVPDGWTIAVGTAGTTVFSTTTAYIGATALKITGNGSELTKITQTIQSPGSPGVFSPQSVLAIAFYMRVSVVPAAGVLRVSLRDGSNNLIGTAVSVTLSAATTTYVLKSASFVLPLALPSTMTMVIELTTALTSTDSVYVDELVLTQMTQFQNGPFLAIIPGNINFIRQDSLAVTVTNNFGGAFQTWFNRIFNMDTLGLVLPSSASPSISDSLIA